MAFYVLKSNVNVKRNGLTENINDIYIYKYIFFVAGPVKRASMNLN